MTPTTATELAICQRFPCDHAYRLRSHEQMDGHTYHHLDVDHESIRVGDGGFVKRWAIGVSAWDDEPWRPYLLTSESPLTFIDPNEALRLSSSLAQATVWALEAL